MIQKIITGHHPHYIKEENGIEKVLVDYKSNIKKGDTQKVELYYKSKTGDIRTAASCSACTKVKTYKRAGNLFLVSIEFTPKSRGLHKKAVRVYERTEQKASVMMMLEAKIKN